MSESWFKDSHLCTICDALIEVTRKDEFRNIWHCGGECNLLSVEDATILPNPTKGNEMLDNLEASVDVSNTYNPNLLVTYKRIEGDVTSYVTDKVTQIEWDLDLGRKNSASYYSLRNKIDDLEEQIIEWVNPNYDKEEVIAGLCEYFGINPSKQVTVTGTISFEVTIDVPLDEVDDFDAHYYLGDQLSLDSNTSSVNINSWLIEDTDVDWN